MPMCQALQATTDGQLARAKADVAEMKQRLDAAASAAAAAAEQTQVAGAAAKVRVAGDQCVWIAHIDPLSALI